jgi:hypothetical protein
MSNEWQLPNQRNLKFPLTPSLSPGGERGRVREKMLKKFLDSRCENLNVKYSFAIWALDFI